MNFVCTYCYKTTHYKATNFRIKKIGWKIVGQHSGMYAGFRDKWACPSCIKKKEAKD